jgi:MoaD family protein
MSEHYDAAAARARLEAERTRVEGLVADLRSEGLDQEESEQSGELTHYDQHPADQASDTFEREKDLAILEGLENELAEIEAALQRLDDGTYGIDEVTGEPIAADRLAAYPIAVRVFAAAREAAGRASDEHDVPPGATIETLLAQAVQRYGNDFAAVLVTARVWLNGDEPTAGAATELHDGDEIAVLPPVSGGAN